MTTTSSAIAEINADQFTGKALGAELAVVDFYSTERPPCENLATKFEPLSELYGHKVSSSRSSVRRTATWRKAWT